MTFYHLLIRQDNITQQPIRNILMSQSQTIRSAFKQCIYKLTQIDTRTQAFKQIQTLINQNKTTTNLRIWISVLSQNRKKHVQSQIYVFDYIIKAYGKNLLDPIDKVPSLEKSVFRITQIISKFFGEQAQNVAMACQKTWLDIYEITLKDQPMQIKKKLLYDNLQAVINGGGGKIAQTTAQFIVDGILQRSLSVQDLQFFKEIAKRVLVLFLKTIVIHPSTLTSLQTILAFFNINNLVPLLQQIVTKILSYIPLAQPNSVGYRIKGQVCNCLSVIGQQIDRNGIQVYQKIIKALSDMATDKVWAVQAPGRKALQIWTSKKKQWDQNFIAKNQRIQPVFSQQNQFENIKQNISEYPKTAQNWTRSHLQNENNQISRSRKIQTSYQKPWIQPTSVQQAKLNYHQEESNFLLKNTGQGGGNNYISAEQYQQRQKPDQTHQYKMGQIKKSIYGVKSQIQFEDTVVLDQENKNKNKMKQQFRNESVKELKPENSYDPQQQQQQQQDDLLQNWQRVLELAQNNRFQQSLKILLQMDDDLYFLRFFLKYSSGILENLTRPLSNKILLKMLSIKKTNFMEQMLFKMVAETAKLGIGNMLTNSQNLQIINNLQNAEKVSSLKQISQRIKNKYEQSLD